MPKALTVTCLLCGHSVETDNTAVPDSELDCPPGGPCCQESHDHAESARSCAADHSGHECADPDACLVYPEVDGCPGGHHGLGVQDCGVCKPLIISASAVLTGSAGGQRP